MMTTAVPALRTTWRRSTEHFAEQVKRFLRLAVLAAAPSVLDLVKGGKFDRLTLVAFVVPVLEVAYRQMFPALGAASADSAPGVEIVPAQVGLTPPTSLVPVQTDNTERPEDGPQDVSQDPTVAYDQDEAASQ